MPKKKLGGGVQRKAREGVLNKRGLARGAVSGFWGVVVRMLVAGSSYLQIYGPSLSQSLANESNRMFRVLVEDIEMRNTVLGKEWPGHRAVESIGDDLLQSSVRRHVCRIPTSTYHLQRDLNYERSSTQALMHGTYHHC